MRRILFLIFSCFFASSFALTQTALPNFPTNRDYFAPRFEEVIPDDADITVSTINVITQSSDGYLWIGTRLGVARYNGFSFINLSKKFKHKILDRNINSIVESPDGVMWIASGYGLISIKDGKLRVTEFEKQFDNNDVRSLVFDREGNLWIGAKTGLYKVSGNKVNKMEEVPSSTIFTLFRDSRNRIWASVDNYGLVLFDKGKINRFSNNYKIKDLRIYSIFEDHNGTLWFGSETGEINRLIKDKFISVPESSLYKKNRAILAFSEDFQNNVWIATIGNGLLSYRDGKIHRHTSKSGLSADAIQTVFVDKENNLWVGTAGAGLNKLKSYNISTYTIKDGLPNNAVWALFKDSKNRVWISTSGSGLCYLEKNKIFNIDAEERLKNKAIRSIGEDNNGNILLGTNGSGLFMYKNGNILPIPDKNRFSIKTVKSIFRDSKGTVWIGTNHEVYTYIDNKFNLFHPEERNPANARYIVEDKKGNIWFGCGGSGLFKWDRKKFQYFDKNSELKTDDILSLYVDKENVLWITTSNGISRIKDDKITNFHMDGILKDLMFFSCIEDYYGQLWLSANIGIVKVSKSELNNYADGKSKKFSTHFFGKEDGLLSTECNGGTQYCGLFMNDGRVWFPTMNGVAIIDPVKMKNPQSFVPNVKIEYFMLNDSSIDINHKIELSKSNDRFEFHFSCLSYKNPIKNHYMYMLEGLDKDWIDAGNRTVAYYTNIPHGDYVFRVKAANSDGVWNTSGDNISFRIRPSFYETWWFYSIFSLFIVGIVYLIYLIRVRALEANRKRLSELVDQKTSQLNNELKERKLAEQELKESEKRYEFVIEGSNETFYDWKIQDNKVLYSPKWAEILEADYDSVKDSKQVWTDSLHPEDKDMILQNAEKHLEGKTDFFEMEYRIITKKGNIRWIYDRGKIVAYDEEGEPLRMSGTIQDITNKKSMEDEFLKMKKIESIGVLAGGIAHDFNNILTSILGNISLAKFKLSQNDYSKIPDLLNNSEKASFRAKDLTYQLLTFSKGGSPIIKTTKIDQIAKEALEFAIHGTKIVPEILFPDDTWLVDIDEGQITQVVQNIVINACQAMPDGGKVTLKVENYNHNTQMQKNFPIEMGEYVQVSIIDEGTGIPKDVLEKIFDPYFTTKESGQGLGLATTYSIIKKHNGTIFVESETGKGSAFIFFLPRSINEISGRTMIPTIQSGKGNILIMDDDKMIRELFREMLSGIGYEVSTAVNGTEAIAKYKESFLNHKFECIIMDLTIPGDIGGKETLDILKEFDPDVKAIVSSGYSNDPVMAEYKKYGFIGVISKPFHIEDISAVLSGINS